MTSTFSSSYPDYTLRSNLPQATGPEAPYEWLNHRPDIVLPSREQLWSGQNWQSATDNHSLSSSYTTTNSDGFYPHPLGWDLKAETLQNSASFTHEPEYIRLHDQSGHTTSAASTSPMRHSPPVPIKLEESPIDLDSEIPDAPSKRLRLRHPLPISRKPRSSFKVAKTPERQKGRRLRASLPEDAPYSLEYDLFTKSNYENILDLTTTNAYPDEFSRRLLIRRETHKVSEKARRERLTSAIRELHKTLPADFCKEPKAEEGQFPSNGNPISKAIVVESATRYIQQLEEELERTAKQAAEIEAMLDVRLGISNEDPEEFEALDAEGEEEVTAPSSN